MLIGRLVGKLIDGNDHGSPHLNKPITINGLID